jgi:hypothetical protein
LPLSSLVQLLESQNFKISEACSEGNQTMNKLEQHSLFGKHYITEFSFPTNYTFKLVDVYHLESLQEYDPGPDFQITIDITV